MGRDIGTDQFEQSHTGLRGKPFSYNRNATRQNFEIATAQQSAYPHYNLAMLENEPTAARYSIGEAPTANTSHEFYSATLWHPDNRYQTNIAVAVNSAIAQSDPIAAGVFFAEALGVRDPSLENVNSTKIQFHKQSINSASDRLLSRETKPFFTISVRFDVPEQTVATLLHDDSVSLFNDDELLLLHHLAVLMPRAMFYCDTGTKHAPILMQALLLHRRHLLQTAASTNDTETLVSASATTRDDITSISPNALKATKDSALAFCIAKQLARYEQQHPELQLNLTKRQLEQFCNLVIAALSDTSKQDQDQTILNKSVILKAISKKIQLANETKTIEQAFKRFLEISLQHTSCGILVPHSAAKALALLRSDCRFTTLRYLLKRPQQRGPAVPLSYNDPINYFELCRLVNHRHQQNPRAWFSFFQSGNRESRFQAANQALQLGIEHNGTVQMTQIT